MELAPYRRLETTPWRPRPQERRDAVEIETTSLTRVTVTRARRVDWGESEPARDRSDGPERPERGGRQDRAERSGEPARGYVEVAPSRSGEAADSARGTAQAHGGFLHEAMTPIPTEGFLGLWASRSVTSNPPSRRAAAAFRANELALGV